MNPWGKNEEDDIVRTMLLFSMLIASMLPLMVIGAISVWQSTSTIKTEVNSRLEVIKQSRKDGIERYMNDILQQSVSMGRRIKTQRPASLEACWEKYLP